MAAPSPGNGRRENCLLFSCLALGVRSNPFFPDLFLLIQPTWVGRRVLVPRRSGRLRLLRGKSETHVASTGWTEMLHPHPSFARARLGSGLGVGSCICPVFYRDATDAVRQAVVSAA